MALLFTRFERARILGARALQVSLGAPPLTDGPDALGIAVAEFASNRLPISTARVLDAAD